MHGNPQKLAEVPLSKVLTPKIFTQGDLYMNVRCLHQYAAVVGSITPHDPGGQENKGDFHFNVLIMSWIFIGLLGLYLKVVRKRIISTRLTT